MKTLVIASAIALSVPVLAQELNVDFGNAAGVPANTYLGAAAKPGNWNAVTAFPATGLVDTSGAPATGVTVTCSVTPTFLTQTTPNNNNSQELYEDYVEISQLTTFTISGLDANRSYDLYFYAWHENTEDTRVRVQPATAWNRVGGAYPVGFDHQNYYSYYFYRVPAGTSTIAIDVTTTSTNLGAANGFQLRERNPVGTNYCSGVGTMSAISTANPGGQIDIAAGDLQVLAMGLPTMHEQYGIFVMSFDNNGSIPISTGGKLCFNPNAAIYRFPSADWMDADGVLRGTFPFDHFQTTLQLVLMGQKCYVQAWYRDISGTNTTDGLELVFQ